MIKFVSKVKGLADIEICRPKLASEFFPEWWDIMPPTSFPDELPTIINDNNLKAFLSQGFVLPMWTDSKLQYNPYTQGQTMAFMESDDNYPKWDLIKTVQMIRYQQVNTFGADGSLIFVANSPWQIITEPGYSVLELPLFFHFNGQFSIMPQVINTDKVHDIQTKVIYHGDGHEITIPQGMPFVQYIPFKRENHTLEIE